jgi:hypothetical protein
MGAKGTTLRGLILPEAGPPGKAWLEPALELLQNSSKFSEITFWGITSVAGELTSSRAGGLYDEGT